MTAANPLRDVPGWRALSTARIAIARANQEPCALCGRAIDYALKGNAKWGPTTDHSIALAHGGEALPAMDELRPAHHHCQSKQGARIANQGMARDRRGRFLTKAAAPSLEAPIATPPSAFVPLLTVQRPDWVPSHLQEPPEWSCWPRIEVPYHPESVGSHGPAAVEWVRQTLGLDLRWWQQYVLLRLLEHDKDGNLIWSEAAISTARQSGKSLGLRALAMWRIHHPALLGEVQTVLHVSNTLSIVGEVAMPAMGWAQSQGYHVRRAAGEWEIRTPAGGRYLPRSSTGGYGFSVNLGLVDECWDLQPVVTDTMITPTLLERSNPQMVLFSTAHPRPTPLFPAFRASGSVDDRRLVLEWSAVPEDDIHDPQVWRRASPHWSQQRERTLHRLLRRISKEDFATQHLNIWPVTNREAQTPFPRWSHGPACIGEPPATATVALDQSHDAKTVGIAAYSKGCVWYRQVGTLKEAADLVTGWGSQEVIVGYSLKTVAAGLSLPVIGGYGVKEAAEGLPLLVRAVTLGEIAHEHRPLLDEQFKGAILKVSDGGVTSLSVKTSTSMVIGPKLVSWLLLHERNSAGEVPAIF